MKQKMKKKMKQKKRRKMREGSLAWYVTRYWKKATVCALLAVAVVAATAAFAGENGTGKANTQPQTEKPVEVNFVPSTAEEMICMECDKYGIDPALPIAIAKFETGHFTSEAYTEGNNVGGLSHDEEPIEFKSLERGVEAFVTNLYHNYYAEGLDTVEEIAPKYCPINQLQWAESVAQIMNE